MKNVGQTPCRNLMHAKERQKTYWPAFEKQTKHSHCVAVMGLTIVVVSIATISCVLDERLDLIFCGSYILTR